MAFRPRPEPAAYPDGWEPAAPEPAELAGSPRIGGPGRAILGRRADPVGRVLRGASLSRLKRPGSPAPDQTPHGTRRRTEAAAAGPAAGRPRPRQLAAASEAAAWNASELPGQAAVTDTAV